MGGAATRQADARGRGRRRRVAAAATAAWLVLAVLVGCAPAGRSTDAGRTTTPSPVVVTAPREATKVAPPAPAPPPPPAFTSTISEITPDLAARMSSSWREGCPVPLADLRYVTVTHHDFAGDAVQGELVVHADSADAMVAVFHALWDAGYPIRSLRLVDDFGGSDDASMAADNTSALNCRAVTGGTRWSEHAYGRAIDVNPVENPYVLGRHVAPPAGREFADRPDAPGVIHDDDVVVQAFASVGWEWGGDWSSPIDYQHFSATGR
nr:M15 family metallopeptidase [Cellulomonas sp.]